MSPEIFDRIRLVVVHMVGLILSICVHEFGHAFVADKLGDQLPRAQGRVTLNPIAHIDPIGTLAIPLMQLFFPNVPLIGWGKPVQVSLSARHLTRRLSVKTSHALISVAGPMMNVLFAMVLSGVWLGLVRFGGASAVSFSDYVAYVITMNFMLAFFNLIPCPPLDGGSILHGMLPRSLEWITEWLQTYGFVILFAMLATGLVSVLLTPATWFAEYWLKLLSGLALS